MLGDDMNNIFKYNLFIFLSTFTRSLIEVFIPILLYNKGLSIGAIFFFLLINYTFSFLFNFPLAYLSKKISFKWLLIISSFFLAITYYYLLILPITFLSLLIIIITHVINAHIFWLSRHYYALKLLPQSNLGPDVGNIVIYNQLGLIPSTYIGALLLSYLNIKWVLIIIVLMYIISVIPLFFIKEKKLQEMTMIEGIKKIIDTIPRRSVWFYVIVQFRMISRYIFPLYIYLFVKNTYKYIGIFNIAVGIASMCFTYFYARKIDKDKEDYLILSGILSFIVWILKLNIISTTLLLLVALFEGLVEKMYETSFNRNLYALGKHYDIISYASFFEGLQHFSRIIIMIIVFFLIKDLKITLYLCAFMLLITGFIGFNDGKGGY